MHFVRADFSKANFSLKIAEIFVDFFYLKKIAKILPFHMLAAQILT